MSALAPTLQAFFTDRLMSASGRCRAPRKVRAHIKESTHRRSVPATPDVVPDATPCR